MKKKSFLLFVIQSVLWSCAAPVDYVNVLQGTASDREFSTGNTYPAVCVPRGMNFWTPQTGLNGSGWQYAYQDTVIRGFKQTHQPSPWINDYGCFSVMPQTDRPETDQDKRALTFSHENETATPYGYSVRFDNGMAVEYTATNAGAVFRFSYPENSDSSFVVIDCFDAEGEIYIDAENSMVLGKSSYYAPNNSAYLPENFATYFTMTFDRPVTSFGIVRNERDTIKADRAVGNNIKAYVGFGKCGEVGMKTASSFISIDQARANLESEIGNRSFMEIRNENRRIWNKTLSCIDVNTPSEEQKRIFYTALYRTQLFPRKTHEYADGRQIHYSFFTGKVEEGPMYADNGFWDTFRAVHPLFTIISPSVSAEFMEALVNIYKEGGWLPEWFSPAYKNSMIGQNSASVVTDAFIKGIGGFDPNVMQTAILKGAWNDGPNATGRVGHRYYDSLGYVPSDVGIKGNVSRTLEYAYNDWCIAEYLEKNGASADSVVVFRQRALNYRHLFDPETGFMRPRMSDGNWESGFKPDAWSFDFVEGSAWHWTWSVFHDPAGLIELYGGDDRFIDKMDSVFSSEPTVTLEEGRKMIHEMREMIAGNMGQYAHGNQPIQHAVYLYSYAGAPYKVQEHVTDIMSRLYSSGIEDGTGLCGDEDNGQTSAWYIFSSLGFYPVCPGSGEYVIGSPLFEKAEVRLENGNVFTVKAKNVSERNIYIQSATLDGVPFEKSYITYRQIMDGGVLEFVMGDTPSDWATDSRPYSLSEQVEF